VVDSDSIGPGMQFVGTRFPSRKAITRVHTLWNVDIS